MIKLGGRCIIQKPLYKRPSSNLGGTVPWVRTPENVALGYDFGKIGTGCLVLSAVSARLVCETAISI